MNINDIKVVFVDVDNTIFDHIKRKKYDLKSINALNALHARGIKIIICSARPIYSLREFGAFNYLHYDGVIASNGAVCIYQDEWFEKYVMPRNALLDIVKVCKKHRLCIEYVTLTDRFYATKRNEYVDMHHEEFFENDALYEEYDKQEVISACLFSPKEMDKMLDQEFPEGVSQIRFGHHGVDVIIKSFDKGMAVKAMLNKIGLSKDNALAFGDDFQDIAMFREVGYGIALGNAKAQLKEQAYEVIKPIYKHGIYHYLKKQKFIKKSIFGIK